MAIQVVAHYYGQLCLQISTENVIYISTCRKRVGVRKTIKQITSEVDKMGKSCLPSPLALQLQWQVLLTQHLAQLISCGFLNNPHPLFNPFCNLVTAGSLRGLTPPRLRNRRTGTLFCTSMQQANCIA